MTMARDSSLSDKHLAEATAIANELAVPLHLTAWQITIAADAAECEGEIARISSMDDYMAAMIEITPYYAQLSADDRFGALAHELIHAVLSPLAPGRPKATMRDYERVTSHLTAIFLDLYGRKRRGRRRKAKGTP